MALSISIEGYGVLCDAEEAVSDYVDGVQDAGNDWGRVGENVAYGETTDTYYQGSASIAGAFSNKGAWIYYDVGTGANEELDFDTSGTEEGQFVYMWVHCPTIGLLQDIDYPGLAIRIGSGTSDHYKTWPIAGNDTSNGWTGGWKCFVIDPVTTGVETGTFDPKAVRYFGVFMDTTAVAKGDNLFIDQIIVGKGLRVTGSDTNDEGWKEIVDYAIGAKGTRAWGVWAEYEDIYYTMGKTWIGSSSVATSFKDTARVIKFGTSQYFKPSLDSGNCTNTDSSPTVLQDSGASFLSEDIKVGDRVYNTTDSSYAWITSIDSDTQITHEALLNGTNNYWDDDPSYDAYSFSGFRTTFPSDGSGIIVEDGTLGNSTVFQDGVKVGTDSGRSGSLFIGNDDQDVSFDLYGGVDTLSSVTALYGTTFQSIQGSINSGNDADHEFFNVNFINCGQFDPVGACEIRNCKFVQTADADAALLWNENIDIEDCNFLANTTGAGIEMPDHESSPYDYDGLLFSGNTYDVLNSSGNAITISKSGSDPETSEGSAVTFIGAAVTTTVHASDPDGNDIENARVFLKAKEWGNASGTDISLNENGASADTITRTTGSFIDDGFDDGTFVNIKGSATSANDGRYDIVSVVALTITLAIGDLTADDSSNASLEVHATGPFPVEDIVTITSVSTVATVTHADNGLSAGDYVDIQGATQPEYNGVWPVIAPTASGYAYSMNGDPSSPATGTVTSTYLPVYGLTNASGDAWKLKTFSSSQPVTGRVRKSSDPYYQDGVIASEVISSSAGLSVTAVLVPDE